jgi:prepilin-type N-terminal cleavage/methylation domain-containing protein
MNNKNQKGFTLIELLVVIAIIGLLSTMSVVALNSAREKSRNTKRLSDIKNIQTALELYYNDNNEYPPADTENPITTNTITGYMNNVPDNPTPRDDGSCPDANYVYTRANSSTYTISYCISEEINGITADILHYATPAGL